MGNIKSRFVASIFVMAGGLIAILETAIYGNVIGTISLIVGIYGVYISRKTMKTTKEIDEELKKAKITATDKKEFIEKRQQYISFFERKKKLIIKNQQVSFNDCLDIISTMGDVEGYKTIFCQQDIAVVGLQKQKVKELIEQKKDKVDEASCVVDLIDAISAVLNIIKKGEYMT